MKRSLRVMVVAMTVAILCGAMFGKEAKATEPRVQPYAVSGVDVALVAVQRTSGNTVTVRWEYRNKTGEKQRLTNERTGWIDPYRLSADAYLLDGKNMVKYPVLRDSTNHPVAATHGGQNSYIYVGPHQTLSTWAKFGGPPSDVPTVTVAITGTAPFEDVPITK